MAVGLVIRNGTFLRPRSLNRRVSVSLTTGEIFCVSKEELKLGLTCQKHASFSFEQGQRLQSGSVTVTGTGHLGFNPLAPEFPFKF